MDTNEKVVDEKAVTPSHAPYVVRFMLGDSLITATLGKDNLKQIDVTRMPFTLFYGGGIIKQVFTPVMVEYKQVDTPAEEKDVLGERKTG